MNDALDIAVELRIQSDRFAASGQFEIASATARCASDVLQGICSPEVGQKLLAHWQSK